MQTAHNLQIYKKWFMICVNCLIKAWAAHSSWNRRDFILNDNSLHRYNLHRRWFFHASLIESKSACAHSLSAVVFVLDPMDCDGFISNYAFGLLMHFLLVLLLHFSEAMWFWFAQKITHRKRVRFIESSIFFCIVSTCFSICFMLYVHTKYATLSHVQCSLKLYELCSPFQDNCRVIRKPRNVTICNCFLS